MKLHVFDFDGTIFRSPVPHPNLGEDWIEWIQGATVEGLGLGFFQELETLGALAGVPENPSLKNNTNTKSDSSLINKNKNDNDDDIDKNNNNTRQENNDDNDDSSFFIHSTIEMAHKAKAEGDHVVVMTGRSEYFLPRIRHLLKCADFPSEEVYAKADVLAGTVKYKSNEICKIVRNLNRKLSTMAAATKNNNNRSNNNSSSPSPDVITDVILYDDRAEQVEKISTRLAESLAAPWPPKNFIIRGKPATPGTTNGSGCSVIPNVHVVNVSAPDKYIPSAELENKLLWRIISKVKERLGPIREVRPAEGTSKVLIESNTTSTTNLLPPATNSSSASPQLQLVTTSGVEDFFKNTTSSSNNNNSNQQQDQKSDLQSLLNSVQERQKQEKEQQNGETEEGDEVIIIMDPKEVLLASLQKFPHLKRIILEN